VQVSADYLSSMTEALNRKANGDEAAPVASPDVEKTLGQLKTLGAKYDITPLEPAKAEDANAYAVTKDYAEKNNLTTLSDLGKLGKPIELAANSDCSERPDCGKGLKSVYGIKLTKIEPLGFGSNDTKNALTNGEVQLGQVGTTDGSLDQKGLVVLEDDKNWQNAENLVPVVNSAWLKKNPKAEDALNKLSDVLTTEDLTMLNAKVDGERLEASQVAEDYLKEKGLT
jgi:osmoprotectant transport system substrate-binding protein